MPKATFLAFTGTPLIAGEERTKEVFGDYVSIYDFQQSVEDGATVPLFYENRAPELQLVNPDLNEDLYRLIEERSVSGRLSSRVLGRQYRLSRDDRLERWPGYRRASWARLRRQGDGRVHRQGHAQDAPGQGFWAETRGSGGAGTPRCQGSQNCRSHRERRPGSALTTTRR
jgi:hypothetical protein